MDNPLENKEFKFYLNFRDEELGFGKKEITEPIGFDASSFNVLQDSDRYGRDVEYSNAEVELDFQRYYATPMNGNVNQLLDGLAVDRLSMGLEYLIEAYKLKGFEADVQFILERNNLEFTVGVLDFAQSETDLKTYFKCKIIQDTDKALFKRRSELKVDLLSSEDLDGNYVEPVQTYNILLRAKPFSQFSKWRNRPIIFLGEQTDHFPAGGNFRYMNWHGILTDFGVKNSYVPFDPITFQYSNVLSGQLKTITAETTLINIKGELKSMDIIALHRYIGGGYDPTTYYAWKWIVRDLSSSETINSGTIWEHEIDSESTTVYQLPDYLSFDIDRIEAGHTLTVYFEYSWTISTINPNALDNDPNYSNIKWLNSVLEIKATSIEVDSVIKGIRHIDLIKKTAEKTAGFNAIAHRYDFGGKFYDNFVFNGYMIRQFLDKNEDGETIEILKPITTNVKSVLEQLVELNQDWQILSNKTLFIGSYKNYYPNEEIGAFIQPSDKDFNVIYNERYLLQGFNYKYEDYEQDKDEKNTIDAVHTEAEFMIPNRQVETIKQIEVPYTRDPFKIENVRRRNFVSNGSTATSEDDKFFIIEVEELPENSTNVLSNVLDILITNDPNQMKIISQDNFRWDLLGFKVGDPFISVTFTLDGTTYSFTDLIVSEIEPTLLTLDKVTDFPNDVLGQRTIFVRLEYPLTDVQYVNRTDNGFDIIENIQEPNEFSNLNYTIRRNMRYWESYIRTASFYNQDKIFKNTYWKSNGELITQLVSESEAIKENESKPISELDLPVVTPIVYETTVVADYDQALSVIDKINTINPDGSIGGFIRIKTTEDKVVKGYVKKLEYNWGTNELNLTLEEKYEPEYISISNIGDGLIYINETGYDDKVVKPLETKIVGNFVQLFDKSGIPLNNPTHYLKYKVNGIVYENVVNLSIAISEIW